MNNADSEKLRGVLELLVDSGNRINQAKPQKYWYPLSQATFGVDEILEALDSMCSFRTTMWEKTAAFEEAFCKYTGAAHAVMVNSGSSADLLMCLAHVTPGDRALLPGDEILIPAVTWPTQIWAALMAGLKVRLVDVNPQHLNAGIQEYQAAITGDTRAIFAVHLMGIAVDVAEIKRLCLERNLVFIEDCCEAQGTLYDDLQVGRYGSMGAFSFFFAHHMCTMEGGMIITDDPRLADTLRMLRAHGWCRNLKNPPDFSGLNLDPRYAFINWGLNVRPTELQAGFGIHQLKKVDAWTAHRRKLTALFANQIASDPVLSANFRFPTCQPQCRPCFFALPLLAGNKEARDAVMKYLEGCGIETRPIVAGNVARHPVVDRFSCFGDFLGRNPRSGADQVHELGFYVGLSPMNTEHDVAKVLHHLITFCKAD